MLQPGTGARHVTRGAEPAACMTGMACFTCNLTSQCQAPRRVLSARGHAGMGGHGRHNSALVCKSPAHTDPPENDHISTNDAGAHVGRPIMEPQRLVSDDVELLVRTLQKASLQSHLRTDAPTASHYLDDVSMFFFSRRSRLRPATVPWLAQQRPARGHCLPSLGGGCARRGMIPLPWTPHDASPGRVGGGTDQLASCFWMPGTPPFRPKAIRWCTSQTGCAHDISAGSFLPRLQLQEPPECASAPRHRRGPSPTHPAGCAPPH